MTDRPSCGCNADLLPFVALTLVLGYAVPESVRPPPIIIFISALLSISPIAYYIGMAVARYLFLPPPFPVTSRAAATDMFPMAYHVSIAAQTNFAIGAMLTAIFGVSIEIILYSMYAVPSTVAFPHIFNTHTHTHTHTRTRSQCALQRWSGAAGAGRRCRYVVRARFTPSEATPRV